MREIKDADGDVLLVAKAKPGDVTDKTTMIRIEEGRVKRASVVLDKEQLDDLIQALQNQRDEL